MLFCIYFIWYDNEIFSTESTPFYDIGTLKRVQVQYESNGTDEMFIQKKRVNHERVLSMCEEHLYEHLTCRIPRPSS